MLSSPEGSDSAFAQPLEKGEANVIALELDEATQRKLEVIESLMEPCDRTTYGEKLRDAAEKLGCSVRTVQRLVQKWEAEGVTALASSKRADRGTHRISEFWPKQQVRQYLFFMPLLPSPPPSASCVV
uniref:helix-turn-helix domain-containing protein n=1 Tax=Trichocoleus desertorum TaxID=1481672 RepID=UPI0025B52AE6|nr:helix-turn-helix domain-containing protein [Trichocoleus desertorum]